MYIVCVYVHVCVRADVCVYTDVCRFFPQNCRGNMQDYEMIISVPSHHVSNTFLELP